MKDVEALVELMRIGTCDDKGMIKRIVGDPLRAAPIKPWNRLTRCARRVLRHVLKETARLLDSPRIACFPFSPTGLALYFPCSPLL